MRALCPVAVLAAALGLAGIAPAQSGQNDGQARRYQSFGYNSRLQQCASPAACGVGSPPPTRRGAEAGGDHNARTAGAGD